MARRANKYAFGRASILAKAKPPRGAAKPAPPSDAEIRKAWAELVAQAATVARTVEGGTTLDLVEAATFAGRVVRMRAAFPLRWPSAQAAAEAFLIVARAFVASKHPPSLAGFLAAGAACLAEQLEGETRARFDRSCAVVGSD